MFVYTFFCWVCNFARAGYFRLSYLKNFRVLDISDHSMLFPTIKCYFRPLRLVISDCQSYFRLSTEKKFAAATSNQNIKLENVWKLTNYFWLINLKMTQIFKITLKLNLVKMSFVAKLTVKRNQVEKLIIVCCWSET